MNETWPYVDAWGQKLDVGDTVKFEGDPATGTLYRVIVFSLDGQKALVYASSTRKYWVPTKKILWIH